MSKAELSEGDNLLRKVAETVTEEGLDEKGGSWVTCSGCHESEDGYDVGYYPYVEAFRCKLGGGCSECGGIGAIWDTTDWADFAEWSLAQERTREAIVAAIKEHIEAHCGGSIFGIEEAADAILALDAQPVVQVAELAADPDLGKIGPGHVCKHGVRWPHACDTCDDEAWIRRVAPEAG